MTTTRYPIDYTYDRHDGGIDSGMAATVEEAINLARRNGLSGDPDYVPVSADLATVEAGSTCRTRAEIERHWAEEIAAGYASPLQVYGGWRAEVRTWRIEYAPAIASLDELLEALQTDDERLPHAHGELDWSSLPSWGKPPVDTREVWSWDDERVLVGTCLDDLTIEPRSADPRWYATAA